MGDKKNKKSTADILQESRHVLYGDEVEVATVLENVLTLLNRMDTRLVSIEKNTSKNTGTLTQMNDKLNSLTARVITVETDIVNSRVSDLETSSEGTGNLFDEVKSKTCSLEKDIEQLQRNNGDGNDSQSIKDELRKLESYNEKLKGKLLDMQCRSMKYNLIFTGLQEQRDENCEMKIRQFIHNEMKIQKPLEFGNIHRFGKSEPGKPRPIIARFLYYSDLDMVKKAGRNLRDEVELFDDGQFSDLSDFEHTNEGDVSNADEGNTYMGNSSATKDKHNAKQGKQSANKGKLSANKGKLSANKGKTHPQSDDGASGLDGESDERATRNWLPDKRNPVESSSSGKRKHVEVNTDSGDESEQETENSSSDSGESSDNDNLFDPSEILKKGTKVPDATGPLAILWTEAEKAKKRDRGLNPVDVIDIVQRALVLIGNAHYVYLTDRRRSMLGRVLPECLDLLTDKDGKKALLKSSNELFGRKFRKLLTEESKDNRELFSLLQTVRRSKNKASRFGNGNFSGGHGNGGRGNNQYFRLEPPNNQNQQFGGRGRGRGRGQSRSTPGIQGRGSIPRIRHTTGKGSRIRFFPHFNRPFCSFSCRGENKTFCPELGLFDIRSLGLRYSSGSKTRILSNTAKTKFSAQTIFRQRENRH
ncbi:Hypothetical predicted protein [Mytilus galloprovincialis]|uniref:Uncharacterized protein n=1 Tax=Mytilus galloprovincialis TaxID=29158 RepID=A0A8B6DXK5_MYTGA|nr:Hypothetical predicted protein [Mytilus galloprovincialis]